MVGSVLRFVSSIASITVWGLIVAAARQARRICLYAQRDGTSQIRSSAISDLIAAVALMTGLSLMPGISRAEELKLVHEVYIETGSLPKSTTILQTSDKGFLIAGENAGEGGWAIHTDYFGKLQWRYTTPLIDPTPAGVMGPRLPTFTGAALASDGSIFLCGHMPREKHAQPGLLTHLDANGKRLSEQLIYAHGKEEGGMGAFVSCAVWGDKIIVAGDLEVFNDHVRRPDVPGDDGIGYYYWFLAFDLNGKQIWEKYFPVDPKISGLPDFISEPLIRSVDKAIFVATRSTIATEIVAIDPDGNVLSKNLFKHDFRPVIPTDLSTLLQFWEVTPPKISVIALSNDFQEVKRLVANTADLNHVTKVYSQLDGSFIFFGSAATWNGSDTAMVLKVDNKLQNPKFLKLGPREESFWVDAAVPTARPGEFASVRTAQKIPAADTPEANKAARLGVVLDILKTNNEGDR
jgi:hypothetical protein